MLQSSVRKLNLVSFLQFLVGFQEKHGCMLWFKGAVLVPIVSAKLQ